MKNGDSRIRLALDTNRYSDLQRGESDVVAQLETADEIVLAFVVVAELRGGFLSGTRARENEALLRRFLAQENVVLLVPDEQTTHHYATLHRQLREQGTPIPQNDIWLAALVAQYDLLLYTRDSHFDYLPQLRRV